MISYGSQKINAETLCEKRSHQLGEGQCIGAEMPSVRHPSQPVYGSQPSRTEMSNVCRSHQLGEGQSKSAAMPRRSRPSRSVYGGRVVHAEMSKNSRSHQLGEGHRCGAAMPTWTYPPRLVYGSRNHNAAMPMEKRSHLFTRGQHPYAEMPTPSRLSREGSDYARRNANAGLLFPTSYRGSVLDRRNAKDDSPSPVLGHLNYAEMLISKRPINFNQRPNRVRRNALYRTPRNQGDPNGYKI